MTISGQKNTENGQRIYFCPFFVILIAVIKNMEKFAKKIFKLFVLKNICTKEEEPLYVYGLMLFLTTSFIILSILILASSFFEVWSGILYILMFPALRVCVGGYHCKTYLSCFIISNFLFTVDILLAYFIRILPNNVDFFVTVILLAISSLYIIHNAPVLNSHNPITARRRDKNRRKAIYRTIILTGIAVACAICAYIIGVLKYVSSMAASVEVTVAILMFVEKIIQKGEVTE